MKEPDNKYLGYIQFGLGVALAANSKVNIYGLCVGVLLIILGAWRLK